MSDSYTAESAEESVVACNPANTKTSSIFDEDLPAAKIISEMVLDAFHTSKESDQIRELRGDPLQAHDAFDDDKAYDLMGQLKQLKTPRPPITPPGKPEQPVLDQPHPVQLKDDPEFQELVYGLALKVPEPVPPGQYHPSAGKGKAARPKKEAEVFASGGATASASPCHCAPRPTECRPGRVRVPGLQLCG